MRFGLLGCNDFRKQVKRLLENTISFEKVCFYDIDYPANTFVQINSDDGEWIVIEEGIDIEANDLPKCCNICIAKEGKHISKKIAPDVPYFRLRLEPKNIEIDEWKKFVENLKNGKDLNSIGIKYGTDKASVRIIDNSIYFEHDYLRHYDHIFNNIRKQNIQLCEYGCGRGASLKMWKEYFQKGNIVGVDIRQEAIQFEEDRVNICIGNAVDTSAALKEKYGEFDIIIDDASHAWSDMRLTLEKSWGVLKTGGYYVLEDVCCGTYGAYLDYSPQIMDSQHIFEYILDRAEMMKMPPDWNPIYNARYFNFLPAITQVIEEELDEVLIFPGTCVLKKRG